MARSEQRLVTFYRYLEKFFTSAGFIIPERAWLRHLQRPPSIGIMASYASPTG
jgi:hypothetical protein